MKIYTRTGDDGTTALFSGGRVSKTDNRVEAYGTVDELNSVIGVTRALDPSEKTGQQLETVQNQLFHLGSDLATPLNANIPGIVRMTEQPIAWLEAEIDRMDRDLPELRNFILPGGTPAAAQLHVARTVCRRAERIVAGMPADAIGEHVTPYLNRLSDWLFTLARWENLQAGVAEEKWSVRS